MRWALDGDSLLLADDRQVRLVGINAPDFGKNGRPDQPLARIARDRASVLTRGRTVRLVYDAERHDRYGRLLAYVFLPDGRELQEILLREGLAWFVAIDPNIARLTAHRAAEAEARAFRRGIWAEPQYEAVPAERLSPADTGFVRFSGLVVAVERHGDAIELQLTPQVRLVIAPSVLAAFGQSPQALRGKRVLARGWLAEYKNHLRLRITHPAMLELLS